jgi:molecular chaperone GrpE
METNSDTSPERLPQENRERIMRGFQVWLDSALADETPPQGLPAGLLAALEAGELPTIEGQCDLYSLWAAMTALTQEVKLQGRAFKQLNGSLAQARETFLQAAARDMPAAADPGEQPPAEQKSGRGIRKQEIDLLLDLHDRLERGEETVRQAGAEITAPSRRSRWTRWFGAGRKHERYARETLAALEAGYLLTQHRLEQALQDYHLSPIECEGKQFDPRSMTAVEMEETDTAPEGTILSVYRAGYEWEGEVYRLAQVKVARPPRKGM